MLAGWCRYSRPHPGRIDAAPNPAQAWVAHVREFLGHAHTAGDVVVFCPQKKALSSGDMIHGILPFIAIYLVALVFITYVPEISLAGVRLFLRQ